MPELDDELLELELEDELEELLEDVLEFEELLELDEVDELELPFPGLPPQAISNVVTIAARDNFRKPDIIQPYHVMIDYPFETDLTEAP